MKHFYKNIKWNIIITLTMKHFYKNIKWNIIITLCRPSMVILITSARCCRESRIAPDGGQARLVGNACLGRGSRHDLCWWGVCAESQGTVGQTGCEFQPA